MPHRSTEHPGRRRRPRQPVNPAAAVAFAVMALMAAGAAAQVSDLVPPTFEFNFSNPGARSMGLGGAFAALADDASAAFANPAGLVQLAEPEVSIEGRSWSYSTTYVNGGRIFGEPFGIGLDTSSGLRTGRSSRDLSGVSFLSLVYPKDRWSFAFYRHQLADFEFRGQLDGLYSGPWPGITDVRREFDQRQVTDLEIRSHGIAAAYRVNEALSVGLGLAYFEGTLSALTEHYGLVCGGNECPPDVISSFFALRPMVPERLFASFDVTIDDTDMGATAGFLWSFSERWKLGGFYRQAPELDVGIEVRAGATYSLAPAGTVIDTETARAGFPDVFGLGLSYRTPGDRLTLSFEWDRVEYSDLNIDSDEEILLIADGDEVRLGAEVLLLDRTPIVALRLGLWRDPPHTYRYQGENYRSRAQLPGGDQELHVAAGLGVAFSRMKLDLGVDFSDPLDTVSLSTVYRF